MAEINLSELERLARAATQGPWSARNGGKCSCATVMCADYPIAKVTRGEWGDEYPAIRLVGDSTLDMKAEAYIKFTAYGEVAHELAEANTAFIAAAAPSTMLALIAAVRAAKGVVNEFDAGFPSDNPGELIAALREALKGIDL